MIISGRKIINVVNNTEILPQEEKLELTKTKKRLIFGVPKEIAFQESRVSLVPGAVNLLVQNGHEVFVEKGAGESAHFTDAEYIEAGAEIKYSAAEVYQADVIIKVAPPVIAEIELFRGRQVLISALHITVQDLLYFKNLMDKKITAISYEDIKDEGNSYPVIQSMSEIAGNTSILIAAEYLSNINNGKGLMLGGVSGISPTEVVIIGAGTVGEFAARSAMALGASVKVFDDCIHKLRSLQRRLGMRIFTSIIQPKVLEKALKRADVAIGALSAHGRMTPCVVTDEMVSQMKEGAVIIDVSIDNGGCFETSRVTNHQSPIFKKYGVIHYCVPNIPSRVSRTASYALSNVMTPILINMSEEGGLEVFLKKDTGVRNGVYIFNGILTNNYVSELYGLPFKDIDLLMAAF